MNKRKAKKKRNKEEMFIVSFCSSYKELRKLDRDYHEYYVSSRRKAKKCVGCEYFINESCIRLLDLEDCIRDKRMGE